MGKRKRKGDAGEAASAAEQAAEDNGALGTTTRVSDSLMQDTNSMHQLRLACGALNRRKSLEPAHVAQFVTDVFLIAGVQQK